MASYPFAVSSRGQRAASIAGADIVELAANAADRVLTDCETLRDAALLRVRSSTSSSVRCQDVSSLVGDRRDPRNVVGNGEIAAADPGKNPHITCGRQVRTGEPAFADL